MKLLNCESPVKVYNKVTHRYDYVPCGKCDVCLSKRNSQWVTRLQRESSCWPFVAFITLTYDELHCPKFHLQPDSSLVNVSTSEYVDSSVFNSLDIESKKLLVRSKGLRTFSVRDLQLFIKRLRYLFYSITQSTYDENGTKLVKESASLRYFIASEYGPTSYRPHYHGLLFFESCRCSSQIDELVSRSWQCGQVDVQFVRSNAASYVAGYCNSLTRLPKVFKCRPFRPFHVCSKCPPLGSLQFNDEKTRKIFFDGLAEISVATNNAVVPSPLPKSFVDRVFPKIKGFGLLTSYQRVSIYGLYNFAGRPETFEEFEEWANSVVDSDENDELSLRVGSITWYLRSILYDVRYCSNKSNSLRRLYYISKRVCIQASVFNCTLGFYVSRIDLYYYHVEQLKLKRYYELQETYMQRYNSLAPFLLLDSDFVELVDTYAVRYFRAPDAMPLFIRLAFQSHNVSISDFLTSRDFRQKYDPFHMPEILDFFTKIKNIADGTHKSKARKEYLVAHPECRII